MAADASRLQSPPVDLQIIVEDGAWPSEPALETLCLAAVGAATNVLVGETGQPMPDAAPELSLLFTDDAAMRAINAEWRAKDSPTNVLSFPASPLVPGAMPAPMLGDIVLAYETISRESNKLAIKFEDHLAHLVIHGYLHLFGYDHIETGDAVEMEALETRILATLGISDPYASTDPI